MPQARATKVARAVRVIATDRRLDAGPQTWRRRLARKPLMNELLQRLDPLALRSERGIDAHPLRNFQGIGSIELAVQIGVDQQDRLIIRRRIGHVCCVPIALNSFFRHRAWLRRLGAAIKFSMHTRSARCGAISSVRKLERPPSRCAFRPANASSGITAGAAQHQYKHSAGDGEVLLEMQQLVSAGKICVKQDRGRQTEQSLTPPRPSRACQPIAIAMPATSCKAIVANERERRHAHLGHACRSSCKVRGQKHPLVDERSRRATVGSRARRHCRASYISRVTQFIALLPLLEAEQGEAGEVVARSRCLQLLADLALIAFCRSSRSSQPPGHSFARMASCSLAFSILPVST